MSDIDELTNRLVHTAIEKCESTTDRFNLHYSER
jgi:hypothetical protein